MKKILKEKNLILGSLFIAILSGAYAIPDIIEKNRIRYTPNHVLGAILVTFMVLAIASVVIHVALSWTMDISDSGAVFFGALIAIAGLILIEACQQHVNPKYDFVLTVSDRWVLRTFFFSASFWTTFMIRNFFD